jgi:glyoxylase-like metal-dependent hydrolase (beta-lactamase superfamily II)/rhodanese-related sulfurtransferase
MIIEQIYTGCLAQGAYYLESNGEAAIIDPLREVGPYLDKAKANGAKIKYVFETHFHADFVSGHLDLAKKSGATIVYGPTAVTGFEAHIAEDGEVFKLGDATIKVLHTPGHTMESTCFLLMDKNGKEEALFTGDTLFIGDVGRPDLAQKAASMTQEDLAGLLYESLNNKIKPLPDSVLIYPAHGAGSACGKNMSKETFDTLGNQKQTNYALRAESKDQFIAEVTDGLLPPPAYFPQNVAMNKQGYESLDTVLDRGLSPLNVKEFETVAEVEEALILDVRPASDYAAGHIPRSIQIGLDGQFAPWVGALIPDLKQNLLLVCPEGQEEETVTRLSRVGYDHTLGFLKGGVEAWKAAGKEVDTVDRIQPEEFAKRVEIGKSLIVDVRKESEYRAEHVEEATNRPLDFINDWTPEFLSSDEHFFLHCAGGYRSMITASILKSRGIHNFTEVDKGFKGIAEETSVPTTDFVCQSKILKA